MNALTSISGFASEHAPAILVGAGIVGFGVCVFLACKATTKVDDILDESKDAAEEIDLNSHMNEEETEKALKKNTLKTRMRIVRNYLPAAIVGVMSITAILVGFKVLNGRYLVATAAYASLEKMYDTYRGRIRDKYGEVADKYGRTGILEEEHTVDTVIMNEDGTETHQQEIIKKDILVNAENADNPFFFLIGPGDYLYDKFGGDMKMIETQVKIFENEAQREYSNGKYVNVNKDCVTPIFGVESKNLTDVGQITGWCKDDKESEDIGDGYVDFGFGTCTGPTMDGMEEIEYAYICPNATQVSFANINKVRNNIAGRKSDRVKVRRGGKYISQS